MYECIFKVRDCDSRVSEYICSMAELSVSGCPGFRYVILSLTKGMRPYVIDSEYGVLTRCETCLPAVSELWMNVL